MQTSRKARGLSLAIAATALMGAVISAGNSASADPKQYDNQLIGVGSDTTQDFMNAMAGFENGISYTPIQSDVASGQVQIVSWDATKAGLTTTCITPRVGGSAFNRPNGSGAGRGALLASFTTGGTTSNTNCGTGTTTLSGDIGFARSSSVSGTAGTTMAYVPFARDALAVAVYRAAGSPNTTFTTAQLNAVFTSATGAVVNGVQTYGCDIQSGSGTGGVWRTAIGGTFNATKCDGLINPATGVAFGANQLQENDGDGLKARGDALQLLEPGAQVIVGMSVGGYIGKANGVARGGMPVDVLLGTNTTVQATPPLTGTRPNLLGDSSYYANTVFGRDIYNVFQASKINSAFGNDAMKQLFKGSTSVLCQRTADIQKFGFLTIATCGDSTTTIKGG
jgi:hypothetical protein